jgi:DNA invertase Pin-like site-specific DNA recombinase
VASGKSCNGRDGLARAQEFTRPGRGHAKAEAVLVARMDRVARDISDFGDLVRNR